MPPDSHLAQQGSYRSEHERHRPCRPVGAAHLAQQLHDALLQQKLKAGGRQQIAAAAAIAGNVASTVNPATGARVLRPRVLALLCPQQREHRVEVFRGAAVVQLSRRAVWIDVGGQAKVAEGLYEVSVSAEGVSSIAQVFRRERDGEFCCGGTTLRQGPEAGTGV